MRRRSQNQKEVETAEDATGGAQLSRRSATESASLPEGDNHQAPPPRHAASFGLRIGRLIVALIATLVRRGKRGRRR